MKHVRACLAILAVDAALLVAIRRSTHGASKEQGSSIPAYHESEGFRTPLAYIGECSTIWTTGYRKYLLPYPVHFSRFGTFTWMAPYLNSPTAAELGQGAILTPAVVESINGTWTARYFAATRFDPGETTTCCCEYLTWSTDDQPRILTDYCKATLPETGSRSMAEVCEPYSREACPPNNASAYRDLGNPFVEVYGHCGKPNNVTAIIAYLTVLGATALAFLSLGVTWLREREKEREAVEGANYMLVTA